MSEIKQLLGRIHEDNQNKQSYLCFEDYQSLLGEFIRIRNASKKFRSEGKKETNSFNFNIELQQNIKDLEERLKNVENEKEKYKDLYEQYKQKFNEENERYTILSKDFISKEAELVKTKQERDRAESTFIIAQTDLKAKIEEFDNKIIQQNKIRKEYEKKLTRIKFKDDVLKRAFWDLQNTKIEPNKDFVDIKNDFFDECDDFDMEYKSIVKLNVSDYFSYSKVNNKEHKLTTKSIINSKQDELAITNNYGSLMGIKIGDTALKQTYFFENKFNITAFDFENYYENIIFADESLQLCIFNKSSQKIKKTIEQTIPIKFITSNLDFKFLTVNNSDLIETYDSNKLTKLSSFSALCEHNISAVAYNSSKNIHEHAFASYDELVSIYDVRSNLISQKIQIPLTTAIDQLLYIDEFTIMAGISDKELHLVDLRNGKILRTVDISFNKNKLDYMRYAAGNNKVFVAENTGGLMSIDVFKQPVVEQVLQLSQAPIHSIFYNSQWDRLITIDNERSINLITSDLK